jgi:two-component system, chemotaxis family, CheB/CheR fusion protein
MGNSNDDPSLNELLDYLRQSRGFDFTGYKRASLERRVRKQMQSHQIEAYRDYLDYLEVHPEEFSLLFNTILINVTAFFRDIEAWQYLQTEIIPHLLSGKSAQSPIRIWSAGCSSGEEAYTLAMIFAKILGVESFRQRVKIYATDLDDEALAQARRSVYSAKDLALIPEEFRDQFFEPVGDQYLFNAELRRSVIFGRHDLLLDAPISRLDLLVCRNALMYFNAETQAKILKRFQFALNNSGILFLGKAEMLLTHANLFTPICLPHRIFRRVPQKNRRNALAIASESFEEQPNNSLERYMQIRESAFESLPVAQIVINFEGTLVLANAAARLLFNLTVQDLGRPLQDLELSYRPLELRSHIDQAYKEKHAVIINNVVCNLPEKRTQALDALFSPLQDEQDALLGMSIAFTDVTLYHNLQAELLHSNQQLESSNEELQSSNEELETTNEELQSTNEELETTNEELQSSNEELETMNEELQSTNEELQTINNELQLRTGELNQANAFLSSVFSSLQVAVIVIDRQFEIVTWNHLAEDLWGLRSEEVQGRSLLGLDIGLPVEQLREPVLSCLKGNTDRQEMMLNARNRRGQDIRCRLRFSPLSGTEIQLRGVILLIEIVA